MPEIQILPNQDIAYFLLFWALLNFRNILVTRDGGYIFCTRIPAKFILTVTNDGN